MIPEVLVRAKADLRVRGAALAVLLWCLEHLSESEWRRVKALAVARSCRLKDWTAARALRRLVNAGYIERRRSRIRRRPHEYRLRKAVAAVLPSSQLKSA